MDNAPASVEIEKKNGSKRFFVFGTVALLLLLVFVFVFFKYSKDTFKSDLKDNSQNSVVGEEDLQDTNSPFGDVAGQNIPLLDNMTHAFQFLGNNRCGNPDLRPIAGEGEIVLEVVEVGDSVNYKVLASENNFFKKDKGNTFSAEYIIEPANLLIQEGDTVFYSYEKIDYSFPQSLKVGDMLALVCSIPDCSDNKLSWALVFNDYMW